MTKKALLIGINYIGQKGELNGCINDANNLATTLKEQYGYNEEDITMLTDTSSKKPEKQTILKELYKLITAANQQQLEELWISYSGHGSYIPDANSDEQDKRDETLVPVDYKKQGMITDDILHHMLSMVNENTKVIVLIDSCHSGSMLDLKYRYISGLKQVVENPKDYIKSNVIMVSGCLDNQTSADFYNHNDKEFAGAMTVAFLQVLKDNNYNITCFKLLKEMRKHLGGKFTQVPQLCCTSPLDQTTVFSLNQKNASYLTVKK